MLISLVSHYQNRILNAVAIVAELIPLAKQLKHEYNGDADLACATSLLRHHLPDDSAVLEWMTSSEGDRTRLLDCAGPH